MYKFVTNYIYLFLLANGFYLNNIDLLPHTYILYIKKYRAAI